MNKWLQSNLLFVALVLVPTAVAATYFGWVAPDVYLSESRFIVKKVKSESLSPLGELFKGGSTDEANSVRDYILSRDALQELEKSYPIRRAYSRDAGGVIDGFPGLLSWDKSFEKLFAYYREHVEIESDPVSSISVLTVHAFTAEDAHRINGLLLKFSEHLVNRLNERSRQDLIRFAANEVENASDSATEAAIAVLKYRAKESVFMPEQQANLQLSGVAKIRDELIATQAQLAQVEKLTPNNPQILGLQNRTQVLRNAIMKEAARVTSEDGSLSAQAPEFTRLTLKSTFADKQLAAAMAELERARSEARQQQVYLETVVQPGKPDKATEPRRIRLIFTVFLGAILVWLMVRLLLTSAREHAD